MNEEIKRGLSVRSSTKLCGADLTLRPLLLHISLLLLKGEGPGMRSSSSILQCRDEREVKGGLADCMSEVEDIQLVLILRIAP
jgi:hypothetical protein